MKVFVVAYCDISHTYFVHETPSAQFQHTSLMVVVSPPVVLSVVLSVVSTVSVVLSVVLTVASAVSVVLSVVLSEAVAAGVVLLGVVLGTLEQSSVKE